MDRAELKTWSYKGFCLTHGGLKLTDAGNFAYSAVWSDTVRINREDGVQRYIDYLRQRWISLGIGEENFSLGAVERKGDVIEALLGVWRHTKGLEYPQDAPLRRIGRFSEILQCASLVNCPTAGGFQLVRCRFSARC